MAIFYHPNIFSTERVMRIGGVPTERALTSFQEYKPLMYQRIYQLVEREFKYSQNVADAVASYLNIPPIYPNTVLNVTESIYTSLFMHRMLDDIKVAYEGTNADEIKRYFRSMFQFQRYQDTSYPSMPPILAQEKMQSFYDEQTLISFIEELSQYFNIDDEDDDI